MTVTVIDIIVTLISIILTLLNGCFLYKTSRHKAEIFNRLKGFELLPYASRFHSVFSEISRKSRLDNWNQAGKNGKLVGDLNTLLVDFNQIQSAVSEDNKESLRAKVTDAYDRIDIFAEGHEFAKKEMLGFLRGIDELLQKEVDCFKQN